MANNWSEFEVEAVVEDYFNMLRLELSGHKYNKTKHRQALMELLDQRSNSSIELKHQNISAVLLEMGIPYIDGYKPRSNYQRSLLPTVVSNYLTHHLDLQVLFKNDAEALSATPSIDDLLAAMTSPPEPEESKDSIASATPGICNPAGINYIEREAQNQSLGEAGEAFALNFERARLIHAGKESLADRIEKVSETIGPSAGYDIRSFEENGTDRFIEVKTTKYGKNTPFYVTPNELRFSRENTSRYFLYRIFKFRVEPRLFWLQGDLQDRCILEPSQFMARLAH